MARKKRIRTLHFSERIDIGALGSDACVTQDFDDTLNEDMFFISADVTVAMSGHTTNEGPIAVIIANSDYTAAEILEWWEATNEWDTGNKIAQEHARRQCRLVGILPGLSTNESLNDGKPVRVPLRWPMVETKTLATACVNLDNAALTTGTQVSFAGQVYARRN